MSFGLRFVPGSGARFCRWAAPSRWPRPSGSSEAEILRTRLCFFLSASSQPSSPRRKEEATNLDFFDPSFKKLLNDADE